MNYRHRKLRTTPLKYNKKKAPRLAKREFTFDIVTKELYNEWCEENPEYSLTFKEFEEIWSKIGKNIWEITSNHTDGVRLPFYTGDIAIKYVNSYVIPTEKNNTNGDIPQLNWNTNGKLGKIVWNITHARWFNKECKLFCFHAYREWKSRVNKALRENPEIFKSNRVGKSNLKNMIK